MPRTVGIVIPAYRPDVSVLCDYVRTLEKRLTPDAIRIELDAAATDVVDELAEEAVTVNAVPYRRGKGAAITAGFEALDTDILLFVDADGSTPVDGVADVLDPILDESADLSVGSRRHPEATVTAHQTFARRYLGDGFAWMARQLLDAKLYDYQCGAKAVTRETWEAVRHHLYDPGFAWDIELVAVAGALDARIAEVPVVWEDQPGSTVSPVQTSLRLAHGLFTARHRAKLLRDHTFHTLLEAGRDDEPSLVDRIAAEGFDE